MRPIFFWITIPYALGSEGGFDSLRDNRKWENEFVTLGYSVAHIFNLTNCWVCGGPFGLESWPWTSVPISPEWLVSNYSEIENDTYWEEDTSPPWPVRYPAQGQYCLNRTQKDGVPVGVSKCNWTYTYGNHCLTDSCMPLNCSQSKNKPIACGNSTNESFVPRQLGWAWINETGHRKHFFGFWSPVNQSEIIYYNNTDTPYEGVTITWGILPTEGDDSKCSGTLTILPNGQTLCWSLHTRYRRDLFDDYNLIYNASARCNWRKDFGSWFCSPDGHESWEPYHPLGTSNTTYFQTPWTSTGLFEHGTRALKGHYWVCGQYAYKILPANWSGICYVGIIRPLFFLLPGPVGGELGVRLYDNLRRSKRSLDQSITAGGGQTWGENEWPPERIIQHYGPATWNPNGPISGAREPIYNLNRIIRLQAVLEIVTNQTAKALDLLADQATQMRTAILQQRMVLDYLLAEEGGVCGKLNNSNCCLKIDNNGQVVKEITTRIRKLADIPAQTGKGGNLEFALWSWVPGPKWVKQLLFYFLCGTIVLMTLPCLIPCIVKFLQKTVQDTLQSMNAVTVTTGQEEKILFLTQDPALEFEVV
ncbi:endogenous retrovirus group V member 2 Env polyprotein-like [Rhea pennata]|uniref:endogenous retrovirus group V member 2 Env polyprotein-like n=1 Tax=Rhea pennata TaxID=8795 RepID=UPI002E268326